MPLRTAHSIKTCWLSKRNQPQSTTGRWVTAEEHHGIGVDVGDPEGQMPRRLRMGAVTRPYEIAPTDQVAFVDGSPG